MKLLKFLFLVLVSVLLVGCPPPVSTWRLNFRNNTKDTLVVTYGVKKVENRRDWTVSSEFPEISFYREMEPDKIAILDFPETAEINVSCEDTISIFILTPDVVKKYSWETIGKKGKYLKKMTQTIRVLRSKKIDGYIVINEEDIRDI